MDLQKHTKKLQNPPKPYKNLQKNLQKTYKTLRKPANNIQKTYKNPWVVDDLSAIFRGSYWISL